MKYELGDIIKVPECFEPVEVVKDVNGILYYKNEKSLSRYSFKGSFKLTKKSKINKLKDNY